MANRVVVACVALTFLTFIKGQGPTTRNPNEIAYNLYNQWLAQQSTTTTPTPTQAGTFYGLPNARILGGSRVYDRCVAPYNAMVALQLFPSDPTLRLTFCSGVMISADTILTAGICVYPYINFDNTIFTVTIGEKSFDFPDAYQMNVNVSKSNFKVHPNYNNIVGDNNIALIKLNSPVPLNDCVRPLTRYVPSMAQCSSSLQNCTITGWGAGDPADPTRNSKWPLYGHIQMVSESLSKIMADMGTYPGASLRENSVFGIPFSGSTIQACLLDWGGMAACQNNGEWQLKGIIAEHNCLPAGSNLPITLTNVEKFQGWITSCANNWSACPFKPN